MEMQGSNAKIFTEWFREYTAARGNDLSIDSNIVKAVDSDELDAKFVEQRIKESALNVLIVNRFCAKCQSLFDHWPTLGDSSTREHDSGPSPDGGWEHAVARPCSTFELESSTRSGCRFCAFLLQNLKDRNLLDTFRKVEARLYHLDENALSSLSIQSWGSNPIQLLWLNLPGKVCTSCNSGLAVNMTIGSCFLPESADCFDDQLDVFDIANNWLSKCTENHDLCKNNGNDTLPTRLISIAGESPRLVLTSECHNKPRYATLSHSWGSYDVIKLTSDDLDTYVEALPVERFPKTFKDGIEITQRLGLDYLWIDSLCIIQDSVEDWQKESALMSSIFGGSTITIAACSARDGRQGCFTKQPYFSGGLRARITDGELRRVQDFHSSKIYDLSTFETHLGTRAWALQEKMLPPRTIHVGDRGAFWECRTTIASEYLPDGLPRKLQRNLVRRNGKLQDHWLDIVRLYSAANLTFGKDKLPALSGIARLGHEETGDLYLAGLWRGELEEQLCWSRARYPPIMMRPRPPMQPRPPWRAPTWSWASIDGEVTWHSRHKGGLDTAYVQVLDAYTTKIGYDPFGQVTIGVIRLACSTMAAGYLVYPSESNYPEPEADATIVLYAGDRELNFSVQIDCQDDNNTSSGKLCYLLPILSGKTGTGTRRKGKNMIYESMIEGIVLQATGITKGEFCRIGSFKFYKDRSKYSDGDEEESYERFLPVLKRHGKATAKASCKEVISNRKHIDKRYVITLV
ncbi:hypothetical protein VE01_03104 [Pseudogymnoascus verrucosus]|uniref:Heterokaryon incompatibility domain-containing protein n=1 Tax=Pseudogymnoascus verrucosus TaxID=342668 RepID=A0A1B8GRE9_9PEZI|nr:uncharacterized protein VE01_03104 [Pseudogymnoascus verrucosus]OBT98380.1 hypothetical protein VE01_03104 [Pseudogymnoascus verrucosus]